MHYHNQQWPPSEPADLSPAQVLSGPALPSPLPVSPVAPPISVFTHATSHQLPESALNARMHACSGIVTRAGLLLTGRLSGAATVRSFSIIRFFKFRMSHLRPSRSHISLSSDISRWIPCSPHAVVDARCLVCANNQAPAAERLAARSKIRERTTARFELRLA